MTQSMLTFLVRSFSKTKKSKSLCVWLACCAGVVHRFVRVRKARLTHAVDHPRVATDAAVAYFFGKAALYSCIKFSFFLRRHSYSDLFQGSHETLRSGVKRCSSLIKGPSLETSLHIEKYCVDIQCIFSKKAETLESPLKVRWVTLTMG